jgi:hypothetical protein
MQDMLNQLMAFHPTLVREEVRLYLRVVYDHVIRVNEATDTMREMLTAAMSVNLSLVTVAQGEIVKRLAGWAALLAAPTLLTSWYGMNFHHMPELDGRYSYWIMIAVTIAICVGLYAALRKARWLSDCVGSSRGARGGIRARGRPKRGLQAIAAGRCCACRRRRTARGGSRPRASRRSRRCGCAACAR